MIQADIREYPSRRAVCAFSSTYKITSLAYYICSGYICSGCDYWYANANATGKITNKDSVVIKSTGHEETVSAAVAATCITDGKTEGKSCSKCGNVLVAQETVSATGHTFGEWKVVKEATGEADGEKARECSMCGEKETEIIPTTGVTDEPDETETPDDTENPDEPSIPVEPTIPEEPKDDGMGIELIVGIVAGVVLVGGAAVTIIFLRKKR